MNHEDRVVVVRESPGGIKRSWGGFIPQHLGFEPNMRNAILARLLGYRLNKFKDCLPEKFALEVIENYLLDVGGTLRWLSAGPNADA